MSDKLWNLETGALITCFNWFGDVVRFSPDGSFIAAAQHNIVTIWDISTLVAP